MTLSVFPEPSSAAPAATYVIEKPVGVLPSGLTLRQTINSTSNNVSGLPPVFFVVVTGGGQGGNGGRGGNSPGPGSTGIAGSSIAFWSTPFTSCVIGAGGGGGAGGGNSSAPGNSGGHSTAGLHTFGSVSLGGSGGGSSQQLNFPSGFFSNTRMIAANIASGGGGAGGAANQSGSSGQAGSVLIYY